MFNYTNKILLIDVVKIWVN